MNSINDSSSDGSFLNELKEDRDRVQRLQFSIDDSINVRKITDSVSDLRDAVDRLVDHNESLVRENQELKLYIMNSLQ